MRASSFLPRLWGWLLLGLLAACQPDPPAHVTYLTTIPDPRLLGGTYVSDPDLLLDAGTVQDLNQRLDSLDRSGRAHIDVVLVNSIGQEVPKTVATALFNKWQIGRPDTDNGLLLLLVLDQHRIEIETGYGLEADLPDITCFRIEQDYMVAPARAGNYDQAVQQGVAALVAQLRVGPARHLQPDSATTQAASFASHVAARRRIGAESLAAAEAAAAAANQQEPSWSAWEVLGILVVAAIALGFYLWLWERLTRGLKARTLLMVLTFGLGAGLLVLAFGFHWPATVAGFAALCYGPPLAALHAYLGWQWHRERKPATATQRPAEYLRRERAHRGLSFTAWLFPGLLALYWPGYRRRLRRLRDAPLACPTCGQPMQRLGADDELPHLASGQQREQHLAAVDYDVWQCPSQHRLLLAYPSARQQEARCPACHYRTYQRQKFNTVKLTSTRGPGWGWVTWRCAYCQHQQQRKWVIPRLPAQPSGGSRRRRRRDESSSSSSSSSSWSSGGNTSYGGSSGGGGAGSSW